MSVKDIIGLIGSGQAFPLRTISRPALFIPKSLYAKKVLEQFEKNKNKFAVVVSEYGSTEDIITLHDLTFHDRNLTFEVMDMDRGRVDKLLVIQE